MARTVDPDGKKIAILDAAAENFARFGYDNAQCSQIAIDAKVGAGTIFRFFPTKEHLANAVFQRACEYHADAHLKCGIESDPNVQPREMFHRLFMLSANFAKEHPNEQVFFEASFQAEFLTEVNQHLAGQLRQRLIRWLKALQDQDVFIKCDTDAVFALTIGSISRLFRDSRQGKVAFTDKILADLETLCWRALEKKS